MVALPGVPRRAEVRNDGGLALADFLAGLDALSRRHGVSPCRIHPSATARMYRSADRVTAAFASRCTTMLQNAP